MEYRLAFFLNIVTVALSYIALLATIWMLLTRFQILGGWTFQEISFLFALGILVNGLSIAFFFQLRNVSHLIIRGDFDRYLLRPYNPFLTVIASGFEPMSFGHIIIGVTLFLWSSNALGLTWDLVNILFLFFVIIGGVLIQGGFFIITATTSFWIFDSQSLWSIAANFREFMWFPLNIYSPIIQVIMSFVVPFAFINFYPASLFLYKMDIVIFSPVLYFLTPLVGLIVYKFAYSFWTLGIKHYQGTGS